MRSVGNTRLIACGCHTVSYSSPSKNIHCPSCSCIRHAEGQTSRIHHSAITPVIVSPGHSRVDAAAPGGSLPLQDGHLKQDCGNQRRQARWLAAHAQRYLSTGNDTCPWAMTSTRINPSVWQVLLHGYHFLFTCKPASPHLPEPVGGGIGTRRCPPDPPAARQRQVQPLGTPPLSAGPRACPDRPGRCPEGQLVRTDRHRRRGAVLYHNSFITRSPAQRRHGGRSGWPPGGRAGEDRERTQQRASRPKGYHLELQLRSRQKATGQRKRKC